MAIHIILNFLSERFGPVLLRGPLVEDFFRPIDRVHMNIRVQIREISGESNLHGIYGGMFSESFGKAPCRAYEPQADENKVFFSYGHAVELGVTSCQACRSSTTFNAGTERVS